MRLAENLDWKGLNLVVRKETALKGFESLTF
jgi:hypothetical protein